VSTRTIVCASRNELAERVATLTWNKTYRVVSDTADGMLLRKKRPKGILWFAAIIFFPPTLAVWALWWVIRPDGCLRLTVASVSPDPGSFGQLSPDGRRLWTGETWIDVATDRPNAEVAPPSQAVVSPDGKRYWDGQSWRPVV
jgi:hypothetical protein